MRREAKNTSIGASEAISENRDIFEILKINNLKIYDNIAQNSTFWSFSFYCLFLIEMFKPKSFM